MGWLFFWIMCAIAAAMIGATKGRGFSGFLAGLLLGPFGVLFAFLARGNRVDCPACKSNIHPEATMCPHCRTAVTPLTAPVIHSGRRETWFGYYEPRDTNSKNRPA